MAERSEPYSRVGSLEMRMFDGTMMRFRNPRMRETAFAQAGREINALSPAERTEFTGNLLRQIGRTPNENRQGILLHILGDIDLTDIDNSTALFQDYTRAVNSQTADINPHYLLEAGTIIAEAIPTDVHKRSELGTTWENAINNNGMHSPLWSGSMPGLGNLISELESVDSERQYQIHLQEREQKKPITDPEEEVPPQVMVMREFLGNKLWDFFDRSTVDAGHYY